MACGVFLALLLGLGIAVERSPKAEPEPTAAPTAKPEDAPGKRAPSPLQGKLRIAELMEHNKTVLMDADGEFPDWIELWNCSDEVLDLEGWVIADGEKKEGWTLPALRMSPDGRAVVFASRKDRRDGELHTDFALSEDERVVLRDAQGLVVDTADCAETGGDVSMALTESGAWEQSLLPTPGYPNSRTGYELFSGTLIPAGPLEICEVMTNNFSAVVTGNKIVENVHVVNNTVPSVVFREKAEIGRVAERVSVTEMIVSDRYKPVLREYLHKSLISADVFGYAVSYLHDTAGLALRLGDPRVYYVISRA